MNNSEKIDALKEYLEHVTKLCEKLNNFYKGEGNSICSPEELRDAWIEYYAATKKYESLLNEFTGNGQEIHASILSDEFVTLLKDDNKGEPSDG